MARLGGGIGLRRKGLKRGKQHLGAETASKTVHLHCVQDVRRGVLCRKTKVFIREIPVNTHKVLEIEGRR